MGKTSGIFKRWKVLVTPKEACDSIRFLQDSLLRYFEISKSNGRINNSKKLIAMLQHKDAVILDLERITSDVLKQCPSLKVISRFGEGYDAIDIEASNRFGVSVTRTRGASSLAVARHTISLILALTHRIMENDRNLKANKWVRKANASDEDMTLGILGFGKIGRHVAQLASAIGFEILVYSRKRQRNKYRFVSTIDELIRSSDILSIHLPLTSETRNIISEDMIKKLEGKYLVNTSRGGLVDEEALYDSITQNGVSGYATDVFLKEPLSGISKKLAMHRRVICTPHIAAFDKITSIRTTELAFRNIFYSLHGDHRKVLSYISCSHMSEADRES